MILVENLLWEYVICCCEITQHTCEYSKLRFRLETSNPFDELEELRLLRISGEHNEHCDRGPEGV